MEISEKGSRVGLGAYVNQVHERPIKKGSAPPVSEDMIKGDRVVLSSKAIEIQEATKRLQSVPDIRQERVTALKKQIEYGTYAVKSQAVAFELIKESLINDLL